VSPYERKVPAASGARAVQIIWSKRRGRAEVEHIGSAHGEAELELLTAVARQRIHAGQDELDLGLPAADQTSVEVVATRMGRLLDAISTVYRQLRFHLVPGTDQVFEQLVTARIVEPTSKQDATGAPEEAGAPAESYPTVKRARAQLHCHAHLAADQAGPAQLLAERCQILRRPWLQATIGTLGAPPAGCGAVGSAMPNMTRSLRCSRQGQCLPSWSSRNGHGPVDIVRDQRVAMPCRLSRRRPSLRAYDSPLTFETPPRFGCPLRVGLESSFGHLCPQVRPRPDWEQWRRRKVPSNSRVRSSKHYRTRCSGLNSPTGTRCSPRSAARCGSTTSAFFRPTASSSNCLRTI